MKKINREFKLPEEQYFSDFDQKIEERLKWSSKDDFRMPEHYFEELNQNILISLAKKRRNKVVSLIRQSVATAAAVSLLVVMYATSFSNEMNQNTNKSAVMLESAEKEDIEIYFEAINWDLQNEDLALLIETINE
ncbi:MAG: hypothetical protein CMC19_00715 [Flavobacteriaceae bacterium]|nr:hypothetical protein [Flavobacteriaceae bacterium]OUX40514.1 MAG: hypothetical protein CBE25_00110 [Flavobacteriaceae bacterium TMED265]